MPFRAGSNRQTGRHAPDGTLNTARLLKLWSPRPSAGVGMVGCSGGGRVRSFFLACY